MIRSYRERERERERERGRERERDHIFFIKIKKLCLFITLKKISFICVGLYFVPPENVSLIFRRHHYRQRTANFDIYLVLMASDQ